MEQIINRPSWRAPWVCLGLAALLAAGCGLTPEAKYARYIEAGKKDLAKKDYSRALIEFRNAGAVKKGDAEPYYQLGLTYIGMEDYRTAAKFLQRATELSPAHTAAKTKLAELLASVGDEESVGRAQTMAQDVLKTSPDDLDALNAAAIAEWRLDQPSNAEMNLNRVLNQAPQNMQAAMNLAKIKFYQKDIAGAEDILKKSAAASPNSAAPVMGLGELYLAEGKLEPAEAQYRRAIQIEPKNELALMSLARLYARTNRLDLAEQTLQQLTTLPDPKYRSAHAMFLFQSGKRDQALAEFEKLVKANPSDRALRTQLIEAYFAVNRLRDADKMLSAALEKNDKDVDARLQRSRVYLASRNYNEAQKDAEQVLRFQKESATAHYILAQILKAKGDALKQRQELTEALRLDRYMLAARLELAQLLIRTKAAPTALQLLTPKELPESQDNLLPVIVWRNWAQFASGNMPAFRKGIDQGFAQAKTGDLWVQDATWKLSQHKVPEARASFEEAIKLNPADSRSVELLGQTYLAQKQPGEAVQKVKEYAAKQPKNARIQQFLGLLLMANGDAAQARAAFNAALTADPNLADAQLSLAQLDVIQHKPEDARKRLEAILSTNPRNATAHRLLASLDDKKGDYTAAIDHFRKAIDSDPSDADAMNNLAYLLADHGNQLDEALKYAERAVELAPDRAAYCDTLGWVLYRKGLYSPAVKYLERASASPGSVVWKYHLAMAYAQAGDAKRSKTTLDAALRINPNLPEAKAAEQVVGKSH